MATKANSLYVQPVRPVVPKVMVILNGWLLAIEAKLALRRRKLPVSYGVVDRIPSISVWHS